MSTTIEQLELEIQSNSTSAVGGIDALSESLRRLKAATAPVSKGGVGLGALSNSLKKFSQSVSGLTGLTLAREQVQGLVDALKPLESVQKSGFNSLASGLDKLVKIAPQIDTVTESLKKTDLDSFADQCNRVATAITPLATQMEKVAAGFSAFPAKIQRLLKGNTSLAASNTVLGKSYVNLAAKISLAYMGLKRIAGVIASWITDSNSYIENLNLFNVSMGQYAEEARQYAEVVGEIMGINPGEWMRNQGVFMTITEGFGVASDRAYTMSKNLTQLTYDLASFFNISTSDAFQKLESGISGELEPLRRLGYDLSVARLQQEAYNLGIEKSVTAMTQAEKAELRYYAIMTQVTNAQGDMARTLEAPANQLRILQAQVEQATRALGNLFLPILKAILPYAIALAKAIRMVAEIIAGFFGVSIPEFDMGTDAIGGVASGAGEAADGLGDASKKAKELKNALLGIDELNVISPPEDSSGGAGGAGGIGGGGGLGFELPTYDFIADAVNEQVDKIMAKIQPFLDWVRENIDEILAGVLAVGAAFLAWRIAKGVQDFLRWLSTMKGFNITGSIAFKIAGLGLFLDAWNTMKEAIQDIMANGPNFTNVTKLISGFAEALGAAFLLFGNIKMAGAMLVISGLTGIVSAISDMVNNGVNWDNALFLVKNLGLFLSGLGMLTGNTKLAGIGLIISGATLIVDNLKGFLEAIRTGDWSNVNMVEVAAGALMLVGGFILTLKKLDALKDSATAGQAAKQALETVTDTTSKIDTTVSTGLSPKLTSLAKNLGLGLVVIAEVTAAALLIVGAIALLGMELEQVGIAWEPVIANGETVAIAIGLGAAILGAVGLAAYALGTGGATIALNIGIGTAILLELGVAAGLFIVEIWAIGKGLDEIGQAWQPVLDNGEAIATAIGIGTGLLVGIGVVTAALGVATVASAGLLPLAIGLGTALLVELAAAFILFVESLVAVADELNYRLDPPLMALNEKLPGLSSNMSDFVDFMTEFAGQVVRYTEVSAIAGLSATIDTIIGWFTQDPIEKLASDVENISEQTSNLNDKLAIAVPELQTAADLLQEYKDLLTQIENLCDSNVELSTGMFVNMKEVGQSLVTGFVDGIQSKSGDFKNAARDLVEGFKTQLTSSAETCRSTMTAWASNVKNWFTQSSYGAINRTTFQNYAKDVVSGFASGITSSYNSSKSSVTTWASNVKQWFTGSGYGAVNRTTFQNYAKDIVSGFGSGVTSSYNSSKSSITSWASNVKSWFSDIASRSAFYEIARDVVNGFNSGINDLYYTSRRYMREWANDAIAAFKSELDSNSPSKVFERIGGDTVLGYNNGITTLGKTTKGVVDSWANSFTSVSPVMRFAVDTSALKYYTSDSFAKSVSADVTSNRNLSVTGFEECMKEFYKEYVEPTLSQMADDMRRQADKNEQTIVQIGNRTVTDAVTTQRKANGYVFVK
nr:MAG TPA: minor tail protein [Caudoviricetes sp.]